MTRSKSAVQQAGPTTTTAGLPAGPPLSVQRSAGAILLASATAVAMLISPALAVAAETEELRLASDAWPPFTNVAGQSRLAIDLVHEALDRAGIKATTSIVEFGVVILGLQDSRFDGSGALWRTSEREKSLLFSEPYLENRVVLVGRAGSDVTAADLSDLAGKRVAVVGAYAYGDTVKKATEPLFIKGQNDQENLKKLLAGEVDYMLVDELLIRYVLQHQRSDAARFLQIGSTPLVRRTLHFAVRKDLPGADSIVDKFNAQIKHMLADGTYNRILQLSWIRADVDGDGRLELVPKSAQAGKIPPTAGYEIVSIEPIEETESETDRFWIDGQAYEGWDAVPKRYKEPKDSVRETTRTKDLPFKFTF